MIRVLLLLSGVKFGLYSINIHAVGNASAIANERKAGPIVGLITKVS
jgi:hypothetical protein